MIKIINLINLIGALVVILATLKVSNAISLSWFWVFSPFWISLLSVILTIVVYRALYGNK